MMTRNHPAPAVPLAADRASLHRLAIFAAGATALVAFALLLFAPPAAAQNRAAPPSLKTIPVPEPSNLGDFVKDKAAAIKLGKALFWDMQVGSDAVQACASCHFHAGADSRFRGVAGPGLNAGDTAFAAVGPNGTMTQDKFPFTQFVDPARNDSGLLRDWNDVVSSPGVYLTSYAGQPKAGAVEQGSPVADPVFNVGGINTRRVEPRNAPTVINAVFNFNNFWDGRADAIFNGSSPLGDADPDAGVWINDSGVTGAAPHKERVRIPYSSLASQSVGPPGSPFEMSFGGRSFPEIGKKLLNPKLVPLGKQNVHPADSVLGPLANSTVTRKGAIQKPGLKVGYAELVKSAFRDRLWNAGNPGGGAYSQMEANFALFFGLAVQLYEATLVSDDSPYDRFMAGNPRAISQSAMEGLNIFLGVNEPGGVGGNCINCHGTSTFSNASVMHVGATNFGASLPEAMVERMIMGDGGGSWYDSGYYNIGVRPSDEDPGRAGNTPFTGLRDAGGQPLLGADGKPVPIPLSFTERALMRDRGVQFPPTMDATLIPPLPCGPGFVMVCAGDRRVSTRGSFKVPTLRNVELTGPYMHNGGEATLMQVVNFYSRGGNFGPTANRASFDPDVQVLCGLNPNPNPDPLFCGAIDPAVAAANRKKLVDFLISLTDERVRWEKAPFDHPALDLPDGATIKKNGATDLMTSLPAVGADGLAAELLPPIGPFLNLDPVQP